MNTPFKKAQDELYQNAVNLLLSPRNLNAEQIEEGKKVIDATIANHGPLVSRYPWWHPFVHPLNLKAYPPNIHTTPDESHGWRGLDHTIYFANAFITCPYISGDEVIDSVKVKEKPHGVSFQAELLDQVLYREGCSPVLVTCEWERDCELGSQIPRADALRRMLSLVMELTQEAEYPEKWEGFHTMLLGAPSHQNASIFLDDGTTQKMKRIYETLDTSGALTPKLIS